MMANGALAGPVAGKDARPIATLRRFAVLAVCLFAGVVTCGHAAAAAKTIVFFGDSLTAGYGLENPAQDGYPGLIEQKLKSEKSPWRVIKAGLSGETTAGGLRRVDWILRQPVGIFVLALGGNDGLRGIDPAVSEANLDQIITKVRARYPEAKVVVAGMQMPEAMGQEYAKRFQAIYPALAKKHDAALVPFLLEGVAASYDLNQSDGIHPTAAGHRLLADNVWNVLRSLL